MAAACLVAKRGLRMLIKSRISAATNRFKTVAWKKKKVITRVLGPFPTYYSYSALQVPRCSLKSWCYSGCYWPWPTVVRVLLNRPTQTQSLLWKIFPRRREPEGSRPRPSSYLQDKTSMISVNTRACFKVGIFPIASRIFGLELELH